LSSSEIERVTLELAYKLAGILYSVEEEQIASYNYCPRPWTWDSYNFIPRKELRSSNT